MVLKKNDRYLTSLKLFIGGIILSMLSFYSVSCSTYTITCYKPAAPEQNIFRIGENEMQDNLYLINNDTISFDVYYNKPVTGFLYTISLNDSVLQKNSFKLNENIQQKYILPLNKSLPKGKYLLSIFEHHDEKNPLNTYDIVIK
ncbi:MAG: hypothetical protein ABIJ97_16370 [Bacteroidota bacterium]